MKNHPGRNKSQNRVMKDPHARSATDRDGCVIAIAFESAIVIRITWFFF